MSPVLLMSVRMKILPMYFPKILPMYFLQKPHVLHTDGITMSHIRKDVVFIKDNCIIIQSGMLLTVDDRTPESIPILSQYKALVYSGNAHYHFNEYKKAEEVYKKALQTKRILNKVKGKTTKNDMPSEVEVRYKMSKCYCHLNEFTNAISVLEAIPTKLRSPKVNVALAELYQKKGQDRSANTCYKEILKECPLSLTAAYGLLNLGVKGAEVASLMQNGLDSAHGIEWILMMVKAHACASSKEYDNAVQILKGLDAMPQARDNVDVLCMLGKYQLLAGENTAAMDTLKRAHAIEPLSVSNMDILASLLCKEGKVKELEALAEHLIGITESRPEPWICMGYLCLATDKSRKALYFAYQACKIDDHHLEALLLKGRAFCECKQAKDALGCFKDALNIAPYRFEVYQGIITCYLCGLGLYKDASNCAAYAFKQLGQSARTFTLLASVLCKDPQRVEKAKRFLEKAIRMDGSYLDAVYLLCQILEEQQLREKGVEILRNTLKNHSTALLHLQLGDFLRLLGDPHEAQQQYCITLRLDPSNMKAWDSISKIEKQSNIGMKCSAYYNEDEEIEGSENEADLDPSDHEGGALWSDEPLDLQYGD